MKGIGAVPDPGSRPAASDLAAMAGQTACVQDFAVVPWRNGRGVTRDIVTCREDDGGLLYQVGIAELTEDAPFSDLSGIDRIFTPIASAGVSLAFDGGGPVACPAMVPVAFAGERQVRLTLPHGPARAFNLMTNRTRHRAAAAALLLPAGSRYEHRFAAPGVILCVSGQVELPRSRWLGPEQIVFAAPGDLIQLTAVAQSQVVVAGIAHRS